MASGLFHTFKIQILSLHADAAMERARELFDEMPEKDVTSWSVIIGGYLQ